jgi:hypothetical protein
MIVCMATRRVTVTLPGDLLESAQEVTGKGVTETIIEGLQHIQRRRFHTRALRLCGKIRLDIDLDESRGRCPR